MHETSPPGVVSQLRAKSRELQSTVKELWTELAQVKKHKRVTLHQKLRTEGSLNKVFSKDQWSRGSMRIIPCTSTIKKALQLYSAS
jgi:hypothetical protein